MTRPRNWTAAVPPRPEAVVQRQAIKILRAYGVDISRRNTRTFIVPGKGGKPRPMFCGTPGDSDLTGTLPGGRRIDIEIKRENWRPPRPRPSKARAAWERQLGRLRRLNELGGCGLWLDNPEALYEILPRLLAGGRVEIGEDERPRVID